jgi:hypothetical protein
MNHSRIFVIPFVILVSIGQIAPTGTSRAHGSKPLSTVDESQEPSSSSIGSIKVDGNQLRLFLVAYDSFKSEPEIPASKRQIQNYSVYFHEDRGNYIVSFLPKLLPGEELDYGGDTKMGRPVDYVIDSKTFRLLGRVFGK